MRAHVYQMAGDHFGWWCLAVNYRSHLVWVWPWYLLTLSTLSSFCLLACVRCVAWHGWLSSIQMEHLAGCWDFFVSSSSFQRVCRWVVDRLVGVVAGGTEERSEERTRFREEWWLIDYMDGTVWLLFCVTYTLSPSRQKLQFRLDTVPSLQEASPVDRLYSTARQPTTLIYLPGPWILRIVIPVHNMRRAQR